MADSFVLLGASPAAVIWAAWAGSSCQSFVTGARVAVAQRDPDIYTILVPAGSDHGNAQLVAGVTVNAPHARNALSCGAGSFPES